MEYDGNIFLTRRRKKRYQEILKRFEMYFESKEGFFSDLVRVCTRWTTIQFFICCHDFYFWKIECMEGGILYFPLLSFGYETNIFYLVGLFLVCTNFHSFL